MKKALLFIFQGFCEFEVAVAVSMLRSTHVVSTVSLDKVPCVSEAGLRFIPDFTIQEAEKENVDVLIIPGGDLEPIAHKDELFKWVKDFSEKEEVVLGAICSGVYVLAKAGLLKQSEYTVTLSRKQRKFLGCFNETYFSRQSIVQSGRILTAQGHAFAEFGIRLNEMLQDVSAASKRFYRGQGNDLMDADV